MSDLNNAFNFTDYPSSQEHSPQFPSMQPYRSELECAIIPSPQVSPQQAHQPSPQSVEAVQRLLSFVQAAEQDRRRRRAWEAQSEARHQDSIERINQLSNQLASAQHASNSGISGLAFEHYTPGPSSVQRLDVHQTSALQIEPSSAHSSSSQKRKRSFHPPDPELPEEDESQTTTKRVSSVHQAVRRHFLALMCIESDKGELPPSHEEGAFLAPSEPVRFVWEKTMRQSVHNTRMKTRIIEDLKLNRSSYPEVPGKDFTKRVLDSAVERQYQHFRTIYMAQESTEVAKVMKRRSDMRALRARHSSRRKQKLHSRVASRLRSSDFEHPSYDGAFYMDCMSSEESDMEDSVLSPGRSNDPEPQAVIRIRGHAWRSARLLKLYAILDESDEIEKTHPSRTGPKNRPRLPGPIKDGFYLPPKVPKGLAGWMISRRWMRTQLSRHPNLKGRVTELLDENGWEGDQRVPGLELLGEQSEVDEDPEDSGEQSMNVQLSAPA